MNNKVGLGFTFCTVHRFAELTHDRSLLSRILGLVLVWVGAVLGLLISLPNRGWKINRRPTACLTFSSTKGVKQVLYLLVILFLIYIYTFGGGFYHYSTGVISRSTLPPPPPSPSPPSLLIVVICRGSVQSKGEEPALLFLLKWPSSHEGVPCKNIAAIS